jgi:hypothetical protein
MQTGVKLCGIMLSGLGLGLGSGLGVGSSCHRFRVRVRVRVVLDRTKMCGDRFVHSLSIGFGTLGWLN